MLTGAQDPPYAKRRDSEHMHIESKRGYEEERMWRANEFSMQKERKTHVVRVRITVDNNPVLFFLEVCLNDESGAVYQEVSSFHLRDCLLF